MQASISMIEDHLNALCDLLNLARIRSGSLDPSPGAVLHVRSAADTENTHSLTFNKALGYGNHQAASSHEEMEIRHQEMKAVEHGQAILTELRKVGLLDHDHLDLKLSFYPPRNTRRLICVQFDNLTFGNYGRLVKKVANELDEYLSALSEVPEVAMQGVMERFTVNGKFPNQYAPSVEALVFKWNVQGKQIHEIVKSFDVKGAQMHLLDLQAT